ncbi:MAG: sulfatase-like hydrolase/transferase [Lachnospiraceae bacterium]|nr:sulfatase-like hydrolase/transferase [Lachnospiraceae bacterium]
MEQTQDNNAVAGHLHSTIFFILVVLYYELLFHGYQFGLLNVNTINIIFFSIAIGGGISVFTNLFPKRVNQILGILITVLIGVIFIIQFLYFAVFRNYMSFFGTLQYANQAADNFDTVILNMQQNIPMMFLLTLPILLVAILAWKIIDFERRKWKFSFAILGGCLLLYGISLLVLKVQDKDTYSAWQMYQDYTSVDMTVEKIGVCETLIVDVREGILGKFGQEEELTFQPTQPEDTSSTEQANVTTEASTEEASTEAPIDTSPNVMDIDFEQIAEESGNSSVASLSEYFASLEPTNKNEYTGMFEGYNVIWITAEGFSGYALDSDLYPTLSMMAEEGFVFENYHSPLWYGSTLGGEYANLMGSMPKNGGYLSMSYSAQQGNAFPFTMGNQLQDLGYHTYAFHNNSYTYYDRHISHPALGYTWIANGSGLEEQCYENGSTLWPQSDLVMVQDTFDTYTAEEPFHLYYLTVSGHVVYSFGGNAMCQKHQDVVADLPYSETTKAYLACQYELELAVNEIIEELKANGLYDNTVIVLAGDHVPYNNMEVLDELAGYQLEDNFEAYESNLIIWSGSMEEPIHVDKVCSSIDILPTVSNLLGLEYDSRLIIGQDILSDSDGLVMFANRSFITDDFSYNASTGEVISTNGETISEETLSQWKSFVNNKFIAADGITNYNYYQYVNTN